MKLLIVVLGLAVAACSFAKKTDTTETPSAEATQPAVQPTPPVETAPAAPTPPEAPAQPAQ